MTQLETMLKSAALGTLRGVMSIGAALAYLQALIVVVAVVGIIVALMLG